MYPFAPEPGRVAVKICGVRTLENAQAAADAGADALGFNFYAGSRRFVPLRDALEWAGRVAGGAARVAVFVNAPADEVRRVVESGLFHAIQLHGDESPEFCADVQALGLPVVRAVSVCREEDIGGLRVWPADALLIDARVEGAFGGTGRTCDWGLAAAAVRALAPRPVHLSGGLTPENVAAAIAGVRPAGVDVAGGVESPDGLKDPDRVSAFVRAARGAAR